MKSLWYVLKNNENGNVLILVAFLMVVLLGIAALVIDGGLLYTSKRQMVSAADAGALAGAYENNDTHAERVAKDYAFGNGAEEVSVTFNELAEDTITVRTYKDVNLTFARIWGLSDSTVSAVATAGHGPGNNLVPFVKIGYPCNICCSCADECTCEEECTCQDVCDDCCECLPECTCDPCTGGVVYPEENGNEYFIRKENGDCAHPGDTIQLKYGDWKESDFSPGNFGYVRFPGQSGGNDLRNDIAGGYTGELSSIEPGEVLREETGQTIGPLVQALEIRANYATSCEFDPDTFQYGEDTNYSCPLFVSIPIVHIDDDELGNKEARIMGFALMHLNLSEGDDKEVYATLIEYMDYDRLKNILPAKLTGFVIRLIQ